MAKKQTRYIFATGLVLLIGVISNVLWKQPAYADCGGVKTAIINCDQTGTTKTGLCNDGTTVNKGEACKDGSQPVFVATGTCPDGKKAAATAKCSDGSAPDVVANSGVWGILILALNILTAGVGIAAVGGIVYGSVLYTSAGDSAEQTKKAKTIIRDVIIGLVAYGLMYTFLNFLIPGGIFK